MDKGVFLNVYKPAVPPIEGSVAGIDVELDKYILSEKDQQAYSVYFNDNRIWTVYYDSVGELYIMAGKMNGIGVVGYIVTENLYSRIERNKLIFKI